MNQEEKFAEPLLSDDEAADMLGLSRSLLRRWRSTKHGPKYVRDGATVRYRPCDLKDWIAAHLFWPVTTE